MRVCGNGRVRPAVPAPGAALRRTELPLAHGLPSTMARHLLDHAERGGVVDRRDLADRLVRADPAVTSTALAVDVLVDEAYRARTEMCREHLLSVVGLAEGDHEPVAEAYALARERGDAFNTMVCSSLAGRLSDEPQPWLHEAYELAVTLGLPAGRAGIDELMRELGVPQPRRRSSRDALSETEVRIVELVSDGFTNRQIAMAARVSEKTVESHLTRLLARTGCRSRVELAAAHLAGTLTTAPA